MLINDLRNVKEIAEAFDDITGDINFLYSFVSDEIDKLETKQLDAKSDEELDTINADLDILQKIFAALEDLIAYV